MCVKISDTTVTYDITVFHSYLISSPNENCVKCKELFKFQNISIGNHCLFCLFPLIKSVKANEHINCQCCMCLTFGLITIILTCNHAHACTHLADRPSCVGVAKPSSYCIALASYPTLQFISSVTLHLHATLHLQRYTSLEYPINDTFHVNDLLNHWTSCKMS